MAGKKNLAAVPGTFLFRSLHPGVRLGTASDRYSGWTGQIYSDSLYEGRITSRRKTVGGRPFTEKVLPVDSVREYFEHFAILEIDATFYQSLIDREGKLTRNYHLLSAYREFLQEDDMILLKVPQSVFAPKVPARGKYVDNPEYLDAEAFTSRFYEPAVRILEPFLGGFIFEQAYQRKKDRSTVGETAGSLDEFFSAVPRDNRYHVELRTAGLMSAEVFSVFEKYGLGQVLAHWTWLPSLIEQFDKSGRTFFNSGQRVVIRLLTPRGKRYEETYVEAFPFDSLVDGMLSHRMIDETVELMRIAIEEGVRIDVIINNRAGGNAPLIARAIADKFLSGNNS